MSIFKWRELRPLILIFLLAGCSGDKESLKDFDSAQWKADKNGCESKRSAAVSTLITQQKALLALNEMEIVDVLGKPDRQEIYKRNEKFFYYYIDPSKDCPTAALSPKQLVIRFNAVGLAKEINVE